MIATKKTPLEVLLSLMGIGGIGLTILVTILLAASSAFMPDGGLGVIYGAAIFVLGFTAGIGLIALSRILIYLRIIAEGSGPGKVFE